MTEKRLPTISAALSFALSAYVNNPLLLLGASLSVWVFTFAGILAASMVISAELFKTLIVVQPDVQILVAEIASLLSFKTAFFAIATYLIIHCIGAAIYLGALRIAFDIVDTGSSLYERLFSQFNKLIPYIIASAIYTLCVSFGLALLVIPGIFLMTVWYLYAQALVVYTNSPLDALRHSYEITTGNRLKTFGFMLVLMLIASVGYSFTLIGPVIVSPFMWLASAYYYRALTQKPDVLTYGYH